MATPDPTEVAPWYLRNINQALALDEASGNVYVRTGFEGNIIITGNKYIKPDAILNRLPYKKGGTFTEALSGMAIENLYDLGYFRQIKLEGEQKEKGHMILHVTVEEKKLVEEIRFVGNKSKAAIQEGIVIGVKELGAGKFIYMADDPIFRNFWEGGKLVLANAVFFNGK